MLSVVVTSYKEERTIGKCLESILAQKLPKEYEIIVVCPDEGTARVAERYAGKGVWVLRDEGKGKPAALNLVYDHVEGDLVFFTDGDLVWGKRALEKMLPHFEDEKVGAVSAWPVYRCPKDSLFAEWASLSSRSLRKTWEEESKNGAYWHLSGYLYGIRKELLEKIPEDTLVDDALIGWRVKERGYKVVFEPEARVYPKFPSTVEDFLKQKIRTRAGFYQLERRYGIRPRGILGELKQGWKDMLRAYGLNAWKLPVIGGLYVTAWVLGWVRGKDADLSVWRRVESTK